MNVRKLEREPARARLILADALWSLCFFALWALLIMKWNTWWAAVLAPLFAIMLAGLGEVMHQGVHGNLFGRVRSLNNAMGRFACAVAGIDFGTYRTWHLRHHRIVNTSHDPERAVYAHPLYIDAARGWKELSHLRRMWSLYGIVMLFGAAIVEALSADSRLVRFVGWVIPLSIMFIGFLSGTVWYLIPVQVFVAWYVPRTAYFFLDFFLAQSRHYGTRMQGNVARVDLREQYEISWNLSVPLVVELMLFRRNLHAEHHEYPGTIWITSRDRGDGRTLPLGKYLRSWWREGPRTM